MSDDLNQKIKQIAEMLGQDNVPDNVKSLLSMLGSTPPKDEPSQKAYEAPQVKEEKPARSEFDENIDMAIRAKKVMERLNKNNDPKINLLHAVRPFLNNNRQKKLNNFIKVLQLSSLTKILDDQNK